MTRLSITTIPPQFRDQAARQLAGNSNAAPVQAKAAPRRESDLQRACEQYLQFKGICYFHLSNRARECAGMPDLIFAINGVPMAAELKTSTGRLSHKQQEIHAEMKSNGWFVEVCRSLDQFRDFCEMARCSIAMSAAVEVVPC